MPTVYKSKAEIPTIDCALVTISYTEGNTSYEFGFDTASKVETETQVETTDAVRLVVKDILRSQKKERKTITGVKITLHDNVFNPELVVVLQGGTVTYGQDGKVTSYAPPVAGSSDKGKIFTLNLYSAQYDAAGVIVNYEKTSFPNCEGEPVTFNAEDDVFRAPEYVINSAPSTGQSPYNIDFVDSLPTLTDPS